MDLGTPHLRLERRGRVAWCTVDNPVQRNALSDAMYAGLGRAIRTVEDDPELSALVVTGVDDVFIVGGDPAAHAADDTSLNEDDLPFTRLHRTGIPIVAAINGHCQASGVWLAVLADVAVASDRARFRLPELRLGVAAPWSSTLLPPIIGLARTKELALTSRPFSAHEALAMGLIARVVSHDDLHEAAMRTVDELCEAAPEARAAWKRAAHQHISLVDERLVEASINTAEAKEGFAAYADHRPPSWSPRHTESEGARING
ncbi:enoyl-CoA hydratase/isomerase family protein [Mycolicibacterium stellerae]|uniref:enoyl-CoA hydratase/isomerase family protein n=1 Tax=Mycolicibacterium stellerae TaxID=2358193 RepID=UPI0013DE3765|nr:enoyl-CoA hydratase/isomerase family protein [Mycolicibacterium stellerae]